MGYNPVRCSTRHTPRSPPPTPNPRDDTPISYTPAPCSTWHTPPPSPPPSPQLGDDTPIGYTLPLVTAPPIIHVAHPTTITNATGMTPFTLHGRCALCTSVFCMLCFNASFFVRATTFHMHSGSYMLLSKKATKQGWGSNRTATTPRRTTLPSATLLARAPRGTHTPPPPPQPPHHGDDTPGRYTPTLCSTRHTPQPPPSPPPHLLGISIGANELWLEAFGKPPYAPP